MSTKTHDRMILDAVGWARSLGYDVVDYNPGTETGADTIFQNQFKEKVILEVVTGSDFRNLFRKQRITEVLMPIGTYRVHPPEMLGLIVVGDRIDHVKKHGVEVGLSEELFDPPKQKVFAVLTRDFDKVIPVLLVSILGARASAYARSA
jgi:hypothetical protein